MSNSQMPSSPLPSSCLTNIERSPIHSTRTIEANYFQNGGDSWTHQSPFPISSVVVSEILTDSMVDFRLQEFAEEYTAAAAKPISPDHSTDLLELSGDLSYFSSFSSDISGELQRLAALCNREVSNRTQYDAGRDEREAGGLEQGFLAAMSTEILDSTSLETAELVVRCCVETLSSSAPAESKCAAAGKLRLLAKYRSDFRELIGESGAIQQLISLLRSSDPSVQENAVTSLLNLSIEEANKARITSAGAIKPLVYALRTGTSAAKQNAACALLNLSVNENDQITIGVCGAIPPLVSLLMTGSSRGKKDALTTLYKLCSVRQNKERAVRAGAVTPLVALVAEGDSGTAEKALVVLNTLSTIEDGREAIVEEGGIPALVEAVEEGPGRGKEFAVLTLLQLCTDSERNRELLVREGAIPPLVALSQSPTARAKNKAETLLQYLRRVEPRKFQY